MSSGSRFTLSDGWWLAWIGAVWLIAVVIVPAFFQYGPRLERRLNSVTSQMEMVSVLPSGNGSLVMAKWTKYRNCEFRDMVWMRVGDDGILKEVTVITRPPGERIGRTLPVGPQENAKPWYVDIPPDEIRSHSLVKLVYRCHPLWISVVDWYP